ncbi:hypothetical protein [Sandarakinorhabdus oryzae]|uniref:hypothetical protein n=1 Tax=Sandarakinorhabdus oryzae TaxID=2675220 RepID=UPI0012E0D2B1|nr:hypothetical protein [Sandarakinorhabdus oryzae]
MIRFALAAALLFITSSASARERPAIVGVWLVKDSAAPFPWHMYVFNADGTMQQANPDAGNPRTSDSDGKGVWKLVGKRVIGKFVEITADRATHRFIGIGEISFDLEVKGNRLEGSGSARFYDGDHKLIDGPFATSFVGTRVTAE